MEIRYEKMHQFFDRIKTLSFWQRIFGWKALRELSYDAYEEFKSILVLADRFMRESEQSNNAVSLVRNENERFKSDLQRVESDFKHTKQDLETANSAISNLKASIASKDETIRQTEGKNNDQDKELSLLKQRIDGLNGRRLELEQENAVFRENEHSRVQEHRDKITVLTGEIERIRNERNSEKELAERSQLERIEGMKRLWSRHQEDTKNAIKLICQRHTIEYVEKVPFKGTPDNTIKIGDEFVIFDAKSPASEDLENFPSYIKLQTESVKKYVKEENVRKEVFLVIPSNTLEVIGQFSYNLADYNVFVITIDALEPIILSLKRLEEYEFVEQLSPEERDNICRVIGKFAHLTKRRIQIDQFFERQFLEMLSKCETDLPHNVLEKVVEFERS